MTTCHSKKDEITNPEEVAALQELIESQIDHLVGVPEEFTAPRSYVYTADGAFEIQNRPFANFIVKCKKVSGGTGRKLHEGVEFKYGKIPFKFLQRALSFFRMALRGPRKSEALYIIMWDPENKEYVEYVPRQHDGPAHAKEIDATERPEGMILVAHIHSHPTFTGKFSGIDNGDDKRCSDGAIFGVIGHVNWDYPDMEWRASVSGEYVPLEVQDVFSSPLVLREVFEPAPMEWMNQITEPPPPPPVAEPTYPYGRYRGPYNQAQWDEEYGWM